jgi:hypothetical protein
MSYINEDDYMNAANYISSLSDKIIIDASQAVPVVDKIEYLEHILDLMVNSKQMERFSIAMEFLEKYKA